MWTYKKNKTEKNYQYINAVEMKAKGKLDK